MFTTLYRLTRNIILSVIVTAVFVHEPTFQLLSKALFLLHLGLLAIFVHLRSVFANAASVGLCTWLADHFRAILVLCAPFLQPVLPWVTRYATGMVRTSPQYLCYVNAAVVEAGKYMVDVVMEGNGWDMREEWEAIGSEVARWCQRGVTEVAEVATVATETTANGAGYKFW